MEQHGTEAALLPNIANQMRSLLSNLYLAASQVIPPEQREQDPALDAKAAILEQSFFRLLRLVNSMSAAEYLSDSQTLSLRDADLVKLVSEVCESSADLAEQLGIQLKFVCAMDRRVCAIHPAAVEQMLYHLLSNALKFTPAGGTVTVELKKSGGELLLSVADTGCGMDKETMQHIFEPFFTTKKTGEGTGLGLALADQIIRTHRGRIRAESTIGRGTTFYVYLPVLEQQQEREQLQWGVDSKLRILAADDNNKVLDLLDKDLSALGLSVSTCSRRGELRQLLEQQPFDVLAIDESLMSSSGVDFCMAIRGRYPGMTRIVMTNAPTREIVDARSHGVIDGYIVKPVSASTLLAQIRSSRKE